MTPLDLFSEPFAKTGNIAAEGFRKLLGRPSLGLLQTVVREALQNSLDACTAERGTEVWLRTRVIAGKDLDYFREGVLTRRPCSDASPEIDEVLGCESLRVFEVADFNTTGLGGPTSADVPLQEGSAPDFVNFFRNVGARRDTHLGGGTYGYGKTSLYALSKCSMILVDTQTTCGGEAVRRIMGCHLGEAFEAESADGPKRYTGRHWWGRSDKSGEVGPLEGLDAAKMAERLGLPLRDPKKTGTTIMVVSPQFEEDSKLELDLVETVLWNFWPRMCRSTSDTRRLSVLVEIDGAAVAVPDPEGFPPLDLFANALAGIKNQDGVQSVSCGNPVATLGCLAMRKGLRADRHPVALRGSSGIPRQSCHIALMRPVELVVKYFEGEPFQDDRFEWAGVFICSEKEDVEQAFADAEPPAHDDWIPDMLPKGYAKTFVRVGLRRLAEIARTFARPMLALSPDGAQGPSLASTATLMGQILKPSVGQASGKHLETRSSNSKREKLAISRPVFSHLEMMESVKVAVFEADLTNDESDPDLRVRAEPYLVMDGGRSSGEDVPLGFSGKVISVSLGDSTEQGKAFPVGTESGRMICRVPVSSEAAVGLRLILERGARE